MVAVLFLTVKLDKRSVGIVQRKTVSEWVGESGLSWDGAIDCVGVAVSIWGQDTSIWSDGTQRGGGGSFPHTGG